MLGGDPSVHVILDLCCGSGSASVAAFSLGYHVVALDTDTKQRSGYSRRLYQYVTKHRQILKNAAGGTKENNFEPIPISQIPFSYGSQDELRKAFAYFPTRSRKGAEGAVPVTLTDEVMFAKLFLYLTYLFCTGGA